MVYLYRLALKITLIKIGENLKKYKSASVGIIMVGRIIIISEIHSFGNNQNGLNDKNRTVPLI